MTEVFIIKEIIEISLGDILIKLCLNIKTKKSKLLFEIAINDDAETIEVNQKNNWQIEKELLCDDFSVKRIAKTNNELGRLIDDNILGIQYGIGKTLYTNTSVIYYLIIITDRNKFLFFNNGDEGAYSFDRIDDILSNDIYNIKWTNVNPNVLDMPQLSEEF